MHQAATDVRHLCAAQRDHLLFGLGLYARYKETPGEFKAGFDDLLSSSGMGEAAELAARFGIDIRSADFWRSSLDVVRGDIRRFESLVEQHGEEKEEGAR